MFDSTAVFILAVSGNVPPRNTARLVVRSGFTTALWETAMENPPTHFEPVVAVMCLRRTDRERNNLSFRYLCLCHNALATLSAAFSPTSILH